MVGNGAYDPINMQLYNLLNNIGVAAALVCGIVLGLFEWRRRKRVDAQLKPPGKPFNFWIALLCMLASAAVMFVGTSYVSTIFGVETNAKSFVGGVLVFIPTFLLLTRFFPRNGRPTRQLEVVMPALPLNLALIRVGCLLRGCCFGIPVEHGLTYPKFSVPSILFDGQPLFPTQPMETTIMLLCCILTLILHFKGKRTLPIFPLVFGVSGWVLTFVTAWDAGTIRFYRITFSLMLLIGIIFLFLVIRDSKKEKSGQKR